MRIIHLNVISIINFIAVGIIITKIVVLSSTCCHYNQNYSHLHRYYLCFFSFYLYPVATVIINIITITPEIQRNVHHYISYTQNFLAYKKQE